MAMETPSQAPPLVAWVAGCFTWAAVCFLLAVPAAAAPSAAPAAVSPTAARAIDFGDDKSARLAWERGDCTEAGSRFEALSRRNPARTVWVDAAISADLVAGGPDAALLVGQTCRRAVPARQANAARLIVAADALRLRRWRDAEGLLGGAAIDGAQGATFRSATGLLHVWAAAGCGDDGAALARRRDRSTGSCALSRASDEWARAVLAGKLDFGLDRVS